jgi:hypothetical protein
MSSFLPVNGVRLEPTYVFSGLLAVVSESTGISAVPSKHGSQEDTGTQDDQIAHAGREQARDDDEAKPAYRGEDRPPRFGSIGLAVDERAWSAAKLGFARPGGTHRAMIAPRKLMWNPVGLRMPA